MSDYDLHELRECWLCGREIGPQTDKRLWQNYICSRCAKILRGVIKNPPKSARASSVLSNDKASDFVRTHFCNFCLINPDHRCKVEQELDCIRHKIDYAFVEMFRDQGVDVEIEQIFEQRIMAGKKEWECEGCHRTIPVDEMFAKVSVQTGEKYPQEHRMCALCMKKYNRRFQKKMEEKQAQNEENQAENQAEKE